MDWDQLADSDDPYERKRAEEREAAPFRWLGALAWIALGFFVIFNSVAIARIQGDMEARIAASEAAKEILLFKIKKIIKIISFFINLSYHQTREKLRLKR